MSEEWAICHPTAAPLYRLYCNRPDRRPLDILAQILEERLPGRLRHFFDAFGPAEAAGMCVALAASRTGAASAVGDRCLFAACACEGARCAPWASCAHITHPTWPV